jgi:predicted RNA-binding protein
VDADVEGETAFTTDIMTEGEFEEKVSKIDLINRIRLG